MKATGKIKINGVTEYEKMYYNGHLPFTYWGLQKG
jgi:hypothetical protein